MQDITQNRLRTRRTIPAICLALAMAAATMAPAAEYVSDPSAAGGGDGSKASPWPSLEQCVSSGLIRRLQPGDTLYLLSGYHGSASLSGINQDFITITAAPGHEVKLSRLSLEGAAKWHIKNLRLSPSFGEPYKGTILSFCDRDENSGQIIIEGCEVFGVDDHRTLDFKGWMEINSGISMGRHGKGSIVRNCYIRNTRFALNMSAYDGVAEGNIIENFSADGIRMTRDGQRSEYNVIKGAFATDGEGDKNHDDAIQCFLHNKGTGTMRNLTINHNILLGHEPGVEPHSANNQGIGLFDGPLVNFHIEGNVVMVSHWHGVSVYDGQDCTIINNVAWTKYSGKLKPWVMLGTKLKQAKNNTVKGNYAMSFNLKQPGTIQEDNKTVTKEIYEKALADLFAVHCEKFGMYHRAAKRHRMTGDYVEKLPDDPKTGASANSETAVKTPSRASSAARPTIQIKEGQSDIFLQKLQAHVDSLLNAKNPRFLYSGLGSEIVIRSKSGTMYQVDVPKMGSQMTIALFNDVKTSDALNICRAIVSENDELANALTAFYCYATNNTIDGNYHLSRAGAHKDMVNEALVRTAGADQ